MQKDDPTVKEFWVPVPVDHPTGRLLLGIMKPKGKDLSPEKYEALWWMKVRALADEQFRDWRDGKQAHPAVAAETLLGLRSLRLFKLHDFNLEDPDKSEELVISLLEMGGHATELLSRVKDWLQDPNDGQAMENLRHGVPGEPESVSQEEGLAEYNSASFEEFLGVLSRG